ncbi:putative wall-associated receptor kinase-like 16 [Triticum aestivum]|uniref:putative wall-associated receptor kinase-like 16 n=1 Tax=Triticum aestivum TaxID=4565 RepID=UPI001D00AC21|nr:putative wall-associated receptor kinase-like 16 [Triticum aestivum]
MATTTILLLLIVLPPLVAAAAAAQRVALPGCRDRCGNITVPYPFGIGAGCFRDDGQQGFQLECDDDGPGSSPRLAVFGYNHRLGALSLAAGEARAYLNATRECYNSTGGLLDRKGTFMSLGTSPYLFSSTKNRLVALGCPNLGFFVDAAGYYVSGCMSVCRPSRYVLPGPCTGVGCCQSAIPPGISFFEPHQRNFPPQQDDNSAFISNATSCHYVFLVEAEWFSYSDRVFLNRTDDFDVPVVLDWAVRNVDNCSAARRNATDFACRSARSECFDAVNGPGYRCNCSSGYDGNPYLDGGAEDIDECKLKDEYPCYGICTNTQGSYTCQCPSGTSGDATAKNGCRPKDKFTLALKVVTGVSVGVFLLVFMCFWLYLGLQKRKLIKAKQSFFEHNEGVILQQQMRGTAGGGGSGFKIFSEEELKKATNNFAADQILGRGGHGIVYRGVLEDKTIVVIKKSKMMEATETKEFAREMLILSQINHRNVVKLHGCCLEVEVPMLVYEYVSNGTLYHYIHGREGHDTNKALDTRLRIAAESAKALSYMHSSASPPILHGDVKTANILLDGSLTAKVSDFGASKLAPSDEVEIATLVQGTCRYLDPEYLMTCQLTDKSDVYSFGVVLLELLTGKKVLCFDGPEEDRSLVSRFTTAVKAGQHGELLDGRVRVEMGPETLEEVRHLVMRCVSMIREERSSMKEVAEKLEALRRYQRNPWGQAGADPEEGQSLLGRDIEQQRDVNYIFKPQDGLNLEEGSTYTFSL